MFIFNNDYDWLWSMIECLVVAGTALLIFRQLRAQTRSHIFTSTENIVAIWNSATNLHVRRHVCSQWISGDKSFTTAAQALAELFEKFGLYAKVGAVPNEIMWDSISWYTEYYHFMFLDGIKGMRSEFKDQLLFENFDLLNERFETVSRAKGLPMFDKTEAEIVNFLRTEIEVSTLLLDAGAPRQPNSSPSKSRRVPKPQVAA